MPMPGGATMLVSGAGDGQRSDGGPALAVLASAWEEKVRSWVYGICVTWICNSPRVPAKAPRLKWPGAAGIIESTPVKLAENGGKLAKQGTVALAGFTVAVPVMKKSPLLPTSQDVILRLSSQVNPLPAGA